MSSKRRELIVKTASGVALACLLAAASACSSHARREAGDAGGGSSAQKTDAARAGGSGFELVNFTGTALRAVYVSPSDSEGWEENVLGADEMRDGDAVGVRLDPEETDALWDIRIESTDGHYAEWKRLDLRGAPRVTLLFRALAEPTVVAEVE